MNNKLRVLTIAIMASLVIAPQTFAESVSLPTSVQQVAQAQVLTNSLDLIANPAKYLNKYVTIKGKFDKFSTLGLDYKPAMRSSEDYITFLIQRDDVKDHNIPLSEMKIFLKRTEAEKYIELNAGDEIQFSGRVFSNALGDVWMDAENFTVLTQKKKDEVKK
ncbi:MAG: hypothetical protein E7Z93_04800 [Cyanobacteria bacterium SIG32]|nr:hypothetical protein [Cyanobacteria bacterium SIG32]